MKSLHRPKSGRRRGFALISALGAILIFATLGLSLAALSVFSTRTTGFRRDSTEAFDLAEAGFRHAVKSLSDNQSYSGQSSTAFGAGNFAVTVSIPGGDTTKRAIESTGTVYGAKGRQSKQTVKGLVNIVSQSPSGTDYAIMADKLLEFSGNSIVNSNPIPDVGHIHTNGKLKISGNPLIDGEASVVGAYELSGSPTYTGGLHTAAAPETIPYPNWTDLKAQATAAGTHSGDKICNGSGTYTLSGVITGKLEIKDTAKVTIVGPVWVKGEVICQGNVQLKGAGAIITDKKLTLGGNGGFTADPTIDNKLMLCSLQGPEDTVAVDAGGPVKVKAGIFAPNGKMNLSGELDIWGFMRGKQVYVSGNAEIIKNTNYSDFYAVASIVVKVAYWKEK